MTIAFCKNTSAFPPCRQGARRRRIPPVILFISLTHIGPHENNTHTILYSMDMYAFFIFKKGNPPTDTYKASLDSGG